MSRTANIYLIACFLLLLTSVARSQTDTERALQNRKDYLDRNSYREKVILIPDRDLYFAGDDLKLSIMLCEGKYNYPLALSKAAAVELIDNAGQSIIRQRFSLEHSRGCGIMHLPASLPSGHYMLRAYTNWMRNEGPETFFHTYLPIINPEIPARIAARADSLKQFNNSYSREESTVSFSMITDKRTYFKRDTVILNFKTEQEALVSISAYLPAMKEAYKGNSPSYIPVSIEAGANRLSFLPEIRGEIISGSLINGEVHKAEESEIFMANLGRNCDLQIVEIRDDGSFFIAPGSYTNSTNFVFLKNSSEKLNILIHPEFSNEYAPLQIPVFDPDSLDAERIEELMVSLQVRTIYKTRNESEQLSSLKKFYGNADQSIILKDYINLPVMEEFFRELLNQTIITRNDGELKINVLSKHTNRIIGPNPLYLVDGIPVFDTKTILDLDPELIRCIHVKAHKYVYGNLVCDGIIDIESIRGDGSVLKLGEGTATYTYRPPATVSDEMIRKHNFPDIKENFPDMRSVICWQPDLKAGKDGQGACLFCTSDLTGKFIVKITVLTQDGSMGTFYEELTIQ